MKLKLPHTYVLLFGLAALAALATHVLPAGSYARLEVDGRSVVDPASFTPRPADPAGIVDVLLCWPRGLLATAEIVFYLFLIGGSLAVVNATGAPERAIELVVRRARGRGPVVIAVLMLVFALGGGTIGIAEETLPFLPALVVLARRLGYDAITGGAIALVGAGAGFSGAFLNPFTVGVGQQIAGLPPYSGLGLRLCAWSVLTALAIAHVLRYAARVRVAPDPAGAVLGTPDRDAADPGAAEHGAAERERGTAVRGSVEPGAADVGTARPARLGARAALVLALFAAALAAMAWGSAVRGFGLVELAGVFLALAIGAGILGGLTADRIAESFGQGAAAIAGGALVVGLARGVLVILDRAGTTDAIVHGLAGTVSDLPPEASVTGIYGVQVLLSYLVPSGSGQAALSLPILVPLGDLVGVTRQTSVLAYQLGDGFSNILTPTQGYFMAALALIGVPWAAWARFLWPLMAAWLVAGLGLLLVAHAVRWGPF